MLRVRVAHSRLPKIRKQLRSCLAIQTTQEISNLRWNRPAQNFAIHFPNVIAHANPERTGNPTFGIISAYRPFSKRIELP